MGQAVRQLGMFEIITTTTLEHYYHHYYCCYSQYTVRVDTM